jgi:Putative transposase
MTLDPTGQARGLKAHDEFIRRFLIHVLRDGFHRIRHYSLRANANRTTAPGYGPAHGGSPSLLLAANIHHLCC